MLSNKKVSLIIIIICLIANVFFATLIVNASSASTFYQGYYIGYGNIIVMGTVVLTANS